MAPFVLNLNKTSGIMANMLKEITLFRSKIIPFSGPAVSSRHCGAITKMQSFAVKINVNLVQSA